MSAIMPVRRDAAMPCWWSTGIDGLLPGRAPSRDRGQLRALSVGWDRTTGHRRTGPGTATATCAHAPKHCSRPQSP